MLRIPYYPGCAVKSTAKNYEVSALAVARKLGIEFVELPRWNCCGVFPFLAEDDLMRHVAPIRNLIRVQEMNENGIVENEYRVVTLCSMCYNTLKQANLFVKDKEKLEKINTFMDREEEYKGGVEPIPFLKLLKDEVGFKRISEEVKRPLDGLKVSPYYGCLLVRPREVGIDDPENPTILEELFKALGAEIVENPNKTQCCGSYHTVDKKSIVAELTYDNLIFPLRSGAEVIVACCPLCSFNLDFRQREARKIHRDLTEIPVMYYTQLMAIALGLDVQSWGLDLGLHYVDPRPVLKSKNLLGGS